MKSISATNRSSINHINALDGVRGLAALIVLISHTSNASDLWGKALGNGFGQLGVMLFFVLSGFLMSFLYLHRSPDSPSIHRYITNRVSRVYPLFLFTVVASFCLWELQVVIPGFVGPRTYTELFQHIFLVRGDIHFWTIPAEMQFYVIFLASWILSHRHPQLFLIVVSISTFSWLYFEVSEVGNRSTSIRYLHFFVAGCCLPVARAWLLKRALPIWVHTALLAASLLFLTASIFSVHGQPPGLWLNPATLFACVMVVLSVSIPSLGSFLFENSGVRFIGKISYSLYLLHPIAIGLLLPLLELGFSAEVYSVAVICAALLLAFVSYRIIEQPSQALIRNTSKIMRINQNRGATK